MSWSDTQKSFAENAERARAEELGYKSEASEPGRNVPTTEDGELILEADPTRRELIIKNVSGTDTAYVAFAESISRFRNEGFELNPGEALQTARYTGPVSVRGFSNSGGSPPPVSVIAV